MSLPLMKFTVCIDPEIEDEVIKADAFWLDEQTGFLKLLVDKKPIAAFAPGKWSYFTLEAING